jgi:hypothetical protein
MDSVEVAIDLQLTNGRGVTGYVGGDFAVGEPLSDEAIANSEAACRDVQPKGGDECLFVPGGMIDLVDDSSPPADPTGLARGIRMAWVNYIRWDGAFATLRALNSPAPDVPTEPGVMPVVRTDELVQLVQQMVWYEDRSSPRGTEQTGPRRLPGPRRGQ